MQELVNQYEGETPGQLVRSFFLSGAWARAATGASARAAANEKEEPQAVNWTRPSCVSCEFSLTRFFKDLVQLLFLFLSLLESSSLSLDVHEHDGAQAVAKLNFPTTESGRMERTRSANTLAIKGKFVSRSVNLFAPPQASNGDRAI